jgi:hypothetical protein
MVTDKELISKLQELKQIKPRKDWVFSVKMSILENNIERKMTLEPVQTWTFSNVLGLIKKRRFAYAFAVFLFIFAGVFGVLKYGFPQNVNVNQVAVLSSTDLLNENTLKSNVADFKTKSQNLAMVAKDNLGDTKVALNAMKDAAKNLTQTIQKDPKLAKTVALDVNNNKSLLDVPGGNDAVEVTDVYKTIDEQLIKDLEGVTLTQDQKEEFSRIKDVYSKGADYSTILRDILLMNASRDRSN